MCSMAILHSRFRYVFYSQPDPAQGALGSCFNLHLNESVNHHFKVYRAEEEEGARNERTKQERGEGGATRKRQKIS